MQAPFGALRARQRRRLGSQRVAGGLTEAQLGHLLEAEQVGRPRALDAALTDDAVVDQLDAVSFVCMEQAALRNLAQRLLLAPVDARVETARGDVDRERTDDPATAAADVPAGDIDARMLHW